MTPRVSGRLVRSFLRYLRERIGEGAYRAYANNLVVRGELLRNPPARTDWVALDDWLKVLEGFEYAYGDRDSMHLLRETTRATMAVAVQKGWSAFLAEVTPDQLLARADTFWQMSYDTGQLVVTDRGPHRCRLEIRDWPEVPPAVVASVAEACVVFLVRLGERGARAVDRANTIEISW